jgi:thymidine kinase
MSGKLIYFYGTVSSSKSLQLLATCHNYDVCGWKVCTIKPALDTRSELIETRAHIPPRKADIVINNNESIYDYNSIIDEADVILIDECQFLSPTHIDELRAITVSRDIDILCFGLRTDYNTHLFPASKRLFELSDETVEIKTICGVCGKHAGFNAKVTKCNDKANGSNIITPSWDAFEQRCWKCYNDGK